MKKLILPLFLISMSSFGSSISYGLKDVSVGRNLDANDGICSEKATVEVFVDLYSLTPEKFTTPESRVYGTIDVKQFKAKTSVTDRSSDWSLNQKKQLFVDGNGSFSIQTEVVDSDDCGIGAWPLGRISLNHDKTLIKKTIKGNVNDLQWQKTQGSCEALLPVTDKAGVVSARIVLQKDCY